MVLDRVRQFLSSFELGCFLPPHGVTSEADMHRQFIHCERGKSVDECHIMGELADITPLPWVSTLMHASLEVLPQFVGSNVET